MKDAIFSVGLDNMIMDKFYDLFVPSITEVDGINANIVKRFKIEAVRMQMTILMEECAELIQAVSKINRKGCLTPTNPSVPGLIEEMAHVCLSMAVVARCFEITEDDILEEVDKKVKKYLNGIYGANAFKEGENEKKE